MGQRTRQPWAACRAVASVALACGLALGMGAVAPAPTAWADGAATNGARTAGAQVAGGQVAADTQAAADAQTPDVAAYINGEALAVSTLTDYIDGVRSTIGSQTNAAWEAYLADQGYTVDEYWMFLITHYAREIVLTQRAEELGLEVSADEVERRIAQIKSDLGVDTDDTAFLWDAYLDTYGFTEESLRANQAFYLLRAKLFEAEVDQPDVDDEMVQSYADAYGYLYGVPRGSDGAADLTAIDGATRERLEQGTSAFAWDCACDLYTSQLIADADIEILVAHQYDVPGQDHDGA